MSETTRCAHCDTLCPKAPATGYHTISGLFPIDGGRWCEYNGEICAGCSDALHANGMLPPLLYRVAAGHSRISHLASIGTPGEDRRKAENPPNHGVTIGARCTVREFVTINGGFEAPTRIGDDCYIMAHSHVGHDCVLHNGVTLASRATLGGHTIVHEGANIGLGAITHQRVTIGAWAMVGAGAVVVRDVPPFAVVVGNPARVIKVNRVGMERAGFTQEQVDLVDEVHAAEAYLRSRPNLGALKRHYDAFDRDKGRHK